VRFQVTSGEHHAGHPRTSSCVSRKARDRLSGSHCMAERCARLFAIRQSTVRDAPDA
jgi:hypothetical protein